MRLHPAEHCQQAREGRQDGQEGDQDSVYDLEHDFEAWLLDAFEDEETVSAIS